MDSAVIVQELDGVLDGLDGGSPGDFARPILEGSPYELPALALDEGAGHIGAVCRAHGVDARARGERYQNLHVDALEQVECRLPVGVLGVAVGASGEVGPCTVRRDRAGVRDAGGAQVCAAVLDPVDDGLQIAFDRVCGGLDVLGGYSIELHGEVLLRGSCQHSHCVLAGGDDGVYQRLDGVVGVEVDGQIVAGRFGRENVSGCGRGDGERACAPCSDVLDLERALGDVVVNLGLVLEYNGELLPGVSAVLQLHFELVGNQAVDEGVEPDRSAQCEGGCGCRVDREQIHLGCASGSRRRVKYQLGCQPRLLAGGCEQCVCQGRIDLL